MTESITDRIDNSLGGSGDGQQLTSRDMTMLKRAVAEGWDIPESVRKKLPAALAQKAFNVDDAGQPGKGDASETAQLRASQILTTMHGQNIQLAQLDQPQGGHLHAHVTAEQLADMTDEQLADLERRLAAAAG